MPSKKTKKAKALPAKKKWPPPTWVTTLSIILSVIIILMITTILAIHFIFINRIYPGISIANTDIGGLTPDQAKEKVSNSIIAKTQKKLTFSYQIASNSSAQTIDLDLSNTSIDISDSIDQAFSLGHSKLFWPTNINLQPKDSLNYQIDQISEQVDQPAIDSQLSVAEDEITVTPSQPGLEVNKEGFKNILTTYINSGVINSQFLPLQVSQPKLSYSSALKIKNRLDQIKLNPIKLTFQNQTFPLGIKEVLPLIDLQTSQSSLVKGRINNNPFTITAINFGNNNLTDTQLSLNSQKTNDYIETIAKQIDRPVVEPLFNFDPSSPNKIKEFQPPTEGLTLNRQKTLDLLSQALTTDNQTTVELPVQTIQPANHLTNDFGIKELIGHGESNFGGSIENRIFNVKLAASRINGVLVPPGVTFSFNNTIGDVTAATGYKQAYVIKSGHTVLDDGGGVCQVSTTLFRAVLNSGLPVVERTAHAYRVHYYENGGYPPGVDATTYYPTVDFKFKNETSNYILVQAHYEGLNLFVDLFGTSDGRVATVTKPVISSSTPPPPDLRQDDPTLPKGTVKQVDFSAAGANVTFKRTVVKDGQTIINETFRSNYRPWQAVYLVGTKEG